jgi:hypothetical protein
MMARTSKYGRHLDEVVANAAMSGDGGLIALPPLKQQIKGWSKRQLKIARREGRRQLSGAQNRLASVEAELKVR